MMFRMKIVDVGVSMVMGVPQNGCFIREDPTKMDDLGVLPFMEPPCVHAVSAEKKWGVIYQCSLDLQSRGLSQKKHPTCKAGLQVEYRSFGKHV